MSDRPQPKLRRGLDDLSVASTNWLNLGDLRALVARADELGWPDSALVSHSSGSRHISRHDVLVAHLIVIEGDKKP